MSYTMAIADDNVSFASAIEKKFALSKTFKVVGTAANGKEMLELVACPPILEPVPKLVE